MTNYIQLKPANATIQWRRSCCGTFSALMTGLEPGTTGRESCAMPSSVCQLTLHCKGNIEHKAHFNLKNEKFVKSSIELFYGVGNEVVWTSLSEKCYKTKSLKCSMSDVCQKKISLSLSLALPSLPLSPLYPPLSPSNTLSHPLSLSLAT